MPKNKPPEAVAQPVESGDLGSLNDPSTFQGFTVHDLIAGLHGVCHTIDNLALGNEIEDPKRALQGLAMAAKVLSAILNKEAHS